MLAPANYYFLHQELCLFVCLQPIKILHRAPLIANKLSPKMLRLRSIISNWKVIICLLFTTENKEITLIMLKYNELLSDTYGHCCEVRKLTQKYGLYSNNYVRMLTLANVVATTEPNQAVPINPSVVHFTVWIHLFTCKRNIMLFLLSIVSLLLLDI